MIAEVTDSHGAVTTVEKEVTVERPLALSPDDSIGIIKEQLGSAVGLEGVTSISTSVQSTPEEARYDESETRFLLKAIENATASHNVTTSEEMDTVMSAIGVVASKSSEEASASVLDLYVSVMQDSLEEGGGVVEESTSDIIVKGISEIQDDTGTSELEEIDWLLLSVQKEVLEDYAPGMEGLVVEGDGIRVESNVYESEDEIITGGGGFEAGLQGGEKGLMKGVVIAQEKAVYDSPELLSQVYGVGVFREGGGGKGGEGRGSSSSSSRSPSSFPRRTRRGETCARATRRRSTPTTRSASS
jgi:hypothetical protein